METAYVVTLWNRKDRLYAPQCIIKDIAEYAAVLPVEFRIEPYSPVETFGHDYAIIGPYQNDCGCYHGFIKCVPIGCKKQ